jgi:hypothetical protein
MFYNVLRMRSGTCRMLKVNSNASVPFLSTEVVFIFYERWQKLI